MQGRLTARMETTLARRLKEARTKRGMRQEDLAKASGLKQSDISKIENGLILKTTGVVALARALRCDPEWLATGEGEMASEKVWPFVLLKADDVMSLDPDDLETVEKVALRLIRKRPSPTTEDENPAAKQKKLIATPKGIKAPPHGRHTSLPKKTGNHK